MHEDRSKLPIEPDKFDSKMRQAAASIMIERLQAMRKEAQRLLMKDEPARELGGRTSTRILSRDEDGALDPLLAWYYIYEPLRTDQASEVRVSCLNEMVSIEVYWKEDR